MPTQEEKIKFTQWYIDEVLKNHDCFININQTKKDSQSVEDFPLDWFDSITDEDIKKIGSKANFIQAQ